MAYAKLRLKHTDCAFIDDILNRRIAIVHKQVEAATSEKELAFYNGVLKAYAELRAKIAAPGGKFSLSEEQLRVLRGALFGSERPDVAKAYASARQSGDDALASVYAAQLAELEMLDDILSRPLVNDRSQDADEDEEGNEEDEGDNED